MLSLAPVVTERPSCENAGTPHIAVDPGRRERHDDGGAPYAPTSTSWPIVLLTMANRPVRDASIWPPAFASAPGGQAIALTTGGFSRTVADRKFGPKRTGDCAINDLCTPSQVGTEAANAFLGLPVGAANVASYEWRLSRSLFSCFSGHDSPAGVAVIKRHAASYDRRPG